MAHANPNAAINLNRIGDMVSSNILPTMLEHSPLPTQVVVNVGDLTLANADDGSNAIIYNSGHMVIGNDVPPRMAPRMVPRMPPMESGVPGCRLCYKPTANRLGLCDGCVYQVGRYEKRAMERQMHADDWEYVGGRVPQYTMGGNRAFVHRQYVGTKRPVPGGAWVRPGGGYRDGVGGMGQRRMPVREVSKDSLSDTDDFEAGYGG
ncbi:hypothetical protein OQA88_13385 [Cercophora sp. LCS_1]